MISWLAVIILGVISLVMLSGRGGFLIAGYNTSGKAAQAQYNEKRLCRVVGGGIGIIALWLAAGALFGARFPFLQTMNLGVILVDIIIIIVLGNTVCKVKNPLPVEESAADQNRTQKYQRGSLIFTLVMLAVVGFFLFTGDVQVARTAEGWHISATYWGNMTVAYDGIAAVEYAEDFDSGSRVNGYGGFKVELGQFQNSTFGEYRLYSYTGCKSAVIIHTADGVVVVNAATEETTKALYQEIAESVNEGSL